MRFYLSIIYIMLFLPLAAQQSGEDYNQEIAAHRVQYKKDFLAEPRAPIKAQDTAFLDFYPADPRWRVNAKVVLSPEAEPFELPTYSGKTKLHRQYATLEFQLGKDLYSLNIYQNLNLIARDSSFGDYLFLPFKDLTNGEETYGGGRYLDFRIGDIQNDALVIDFNKAYNPYCAYSDGYNCPIPPANNHLKVAVKAGEKQYRGEKKH